MSTLSFATVELVSGMPMSRVISSDTATSAPCTATAMPFVAPSIPSLVAPSVTQTWHRAALHNSIKPEGANVPANAGRAYGVAKQAAPPRGIPR